MYRYFPGASISKIHGQPKRVGNFLVVPMFHPAAALHQPKWRPLVEADFKKLPGLIAEAANYGDHEPPPQAQQLSLF
jgi:DNA polymerase